jgi:hypothetical protein
MPQNNDNNTQELLNAIGDMSFLPKEVKDENLGRDFLKLSKAEKIFRIVWTSIMGAGLISYLVCLFIYGIKGKYFDSISGLNYGWLGLIVTAIFSIFFVLTILFGHLYDAELSIFSQEENRKKFKPFVTISFYACFLLMYGMFMTTVLRGAIFNKVFSAYGWFLSNLGVFTYILIALVTIGGVVLTYLKPKIAKVYNLSVLALSGWIVIFFTALLQKSFVMSSNYGIMMLIFGAIFIDLAIPFLLLQKKHQGMRSAFYVMVSIGVIFDLLAIIIYGLF